MRQAEWRRIVKPLLPVGERWEFKGSLTYRAPVNRILFGVAGESSSFSKGVYVERVTFPLFVPEPGINLGYSKRVGGGARIYQPSEVGELEEAIREGIRPVGTERDTLIWLAERDSDSKNSRSREIAGYAHLFLGSPIQARDVLTSVAEEEARLDWEQEIIDRAQSVLDLLEAEGLVSAVHQLDTWVEWTCAHNGFIRE